MTSPFAQGGRKPSAQPQPEHLEWKASQLQQCSEAGSLRNCEFRKATRRLERETGAEKSPAMMPGGSDQSAGPVIIRARAAKTAMRLGPPQTGSRKL